VMMISWMTAVILVAMLVGYIELKFETQEMRKEINKIKDQLDSGQ
jgi:hypothetical protein